eukprot:COSAG06_NODE_2497_length_6757_cov_80.480625_6_plen_73_part_00
MLQERKNAGANIVLTTHSMEEADTLGDTIGIMADGKLEAFGPSLGAENGVLFIKTNKHYCFFHIFFIFTSFS